MKPVIVGCRVENFTDEQLVVFKNHQPLGMIVFAEPCKKGPDTVRHVVNQFLSVCPHGRILMDAEGGRVNRLKPEFGHGWREVPGARDFAKMAETDLGKAREAICLNAQLIAHDLISLGINADCAPVVDLVSEEVLVNVNDDGKPHATSASLYARSFGDDPYIVTECAKAFADGLHSLGVCSILKHAPGYGRIAVDPHYGLYNIRATKAEMMQTDLVPYRAMKDYPAIMTAHTVYDAIDPEYPATLSPTIMKMIREDVGFGGVIIADSIEMNSVYPQGFSTTERDQFGMGLPLPGTLTYITKRLLDAGCDIVLHSDCSRDFAHTVEILEAAPVLSADRAQWLVNKMTIAPSINHFDRDKALQRLAALR